jgi:hypothetical protein
MDLFSLLGYLSIRALMLSLIFIVVQRGGGGEERDENVGRDQRHRMTQRNL